MTVYVRQPGESVRAFDKRCAKATAADTIVLDEAMFVPPHHPDGSDVDKALSLALDAHGDVAVLSAEVRKLTAEVDELHGDRMRVMAERDALRGAAESSIAQCQRNCTMESYCGNCAPLLVALLSDAAPTPPPDTVAVPRALLERVATALFCIGCKEPLCGHWCTHCDRSVDDNGALAPELRALLRSGR